MAGLCLFQVLCAVALEEASNLQWWSVSNVFTIFFKVWQLCFDDSLDVGDRIPEKLTSWIKGVCCIGLLEPLLGCNFSVIYLLFFSHCINLA